METSVSHILEFTVNHCWFSHRQVVTYFALVICTVILTRAYSQPGPRSKDQLIVATRQHTLGGCFTRTLAPGRVSFTGAEMSPVPVLQAPPKSPFLWHKKKVWPTES